MCEVGIWRRNGVGVAVRS